MTLLVTVTPVDADGEGKGLPVVMDFAAAVGEGAGFTPAANIASSAEFGNLAAATTAYNALLTALKNAGLMVAD